jgi:hypothetical protein
MGSHGLNPTTAATMLAMTALGAGATIYLRQKHPELASPVRAAGVVGESSWGALLPGDASC